MLLKINKSFRSPLVNAFPFSKRNHKLIYYGNDCRSRMLEGITLLNKCTSVTLGPKVLLLFCKSNQGRNVLIETELG